MNVNELLAFENRDGAEDAKGWNRFDWDIEFTRQGVDDKWAETTLNYDYSVGLSPETTNRSGSTSL